MKGAIELLTEANMTITDLAVRMLDNSTKKIALDAIADFRSKLRGTVALPGRRLRHCPHYLERNGRSTARSRRALSWCC